MSLELVAGELQEEKKSKKKKKDRYPLANRCASRSVTGNWKSARLEEENCMMIQSKGERQERQGRIGSMRRKSLLPPAEVTLLCICIHSGG